MTRPFRPDDLYRFRIADRPAPLAGRLARAVFTVQTVAPAKDGYRHALWAVADRRQATSRAS